MVSLYQMEQRRHGAYLAQMQRPLCNLQWFSRWWELRPGEKQMSAYEVCITMPMSGISHAWIQEAEKMQKVAVGLFFQVSRT